MTSTLNPTNARRVPPWLVGLLLAAMTAAVFWPATGFEFINMDDDTYVTANAQVLGGLTWENFRWAFAGLRAGFWHPVTWLSLQADVSFWGAGAEGFHRTNILLHASNVVLVFALLRRLTGSVWRSAMVAAVFGLHPLRVEPVAWVSGRKELLAAMFGLLTLVSYASWQTNKGNGRKYYWLALGCFALALMSKPVVVMLPVVMLLLDVWPLKRESGWWLLVREKIPFALLGVVVAWLTMQGNFHASNSSVAMMEHPMSQRLANAAVAGWGYLGQLAWPAGLAAYYPFPKTIGSSEVVGALAVLILISVLAWRARGKFWAMGWGWYLALLLPVSGIVQVGSHAHADRYTYLPLIGIIWAMVWGVAEFLARVRMLKIISAMFAAALLVGCGWRTRGQLALWHDSGSLFAHTAAVTDGNFFAEALRGNYLAGHGEAVAARECFARVLRLRPDYADAWNGLGLVESALGRRAEAATAYRRAVVLDARHVGAMSNLGMLLAASGKVDEAIALYRQALAVNPDEPTVLNNLGFALTGQGRFAEAISCGERAVRLRPGDAGFHVNLAAALGKGGQPMAAVTEYREALRLNPDLREVREFLRAVDGK